MKQLFSNRKQAFNFPLVLTFSLTLSSCSCVLDSQQRPKIGSCVIVYAPLHNRVSVTFESYCIKVSEAAKMNNII